MFKLELMAHHVYWLHFTSLEFVPWRVPYVVSGASDLSPRVLQDAYKSAYYSFLEVEIKLCHFHTQSRSPTRKSLLPRCQDCRGCHSIVVSREYKGNYHNKAFLSFFVDASAAIPDLGPTEQDHGLTMSPIVRPGTGTSRLDNDFMSHSRSLSCFLSCSNSCYY